MTLLKIENKIRMFYKFIGDSGHGCSKITVCINWQLVHEVNPGNRCSP